MLFLKRGEECELVSYFCAREGGMLIALGGTFELGSSIRRRFVSFSHIIWSSACDLVCGGIVTQVKQSRE